MILYVDETENDQFFIVAGLLVNSEKDVLESYKRFKNSVKEIKIPRKYKSKAFKEFKSIIIDKHYRKINIKMLKEINTVSYRIIYGVYEKNNVLFNQQKKEKVYIGLLLSLITNIDENIEIIYDEFCNKKFEINIESNIKKCKNVLSIKPENSQNNPGLQYVDNVCSVIRLKLTKLDKNNFYNYISKIIRNNSCVKK